MASKSDEINVKLTGTGLSFDRKVSEEVASKIITFIIGGGTGYWAAETQALQIRALHNRTHCPERQPRE